MTKWEGPELVIKREGEGVNFLETDCLTGNKTVPSLVPLRFFQQRKTQYSREKVLRQFIRVISHPNSPVHF
ncbi:hypothetical protein L2E82_48735 [Cichorium intybus]|uniref:Uncharacterized protein n=1 Tax=Cichorium intybus TaxID=13427 RepID=A0ACB8YXZ4_CICIN|nr:hypothetical protein L2E82_48735 [Cichorium intybus]